MVFVRFAGCNLNCPWCDTDHDQQYVATGEEILTKIKKYPADTVCLTGGEPVLQIDTELLAKLSDYAVHIETNGTRAVEAESVDWLTVSPKENWIQKHGDELKVVYTGQDLEPYFDSRFVHYSLQPEWGAENQEQVIKIVKEDPRWRLSIQTQKYLKIR